MPNSGLLFWGLPVYRTLQRRPCTMTCCGIRRDGGYCAATLHDGALMTTTALHQCQSCQHGVNVTNESVIHRFRVVSE